jgi:hypothetical protein
MTLERVATIDLDAARALTEPLPRRDTAPSWWLRGWLWLFAIGRVLHTWSAAEAVGPGIALRAEMLGEASADVARARMRAERFRRIWVAGKALRLAKRYRDYDAPEVLAVFDEASRLLALDMPTGERRAVPEAPGRA